MERRIIQRNTSKLITIENAKKLNQKMKMLSADFKVDTTYIGVDRVADIIIDYIRGGLNNEFN